MLYKTAMTASVTMRWGRTASLAWRWFILQATSGEAVSGLAIRDYRDA
jgi:hypothetical protein